MTIDMKAEAQQFCREYQFVPVAIAQAAMERGAALAMAAITADLKAMREEMNKNRKLIERGTPHGHKSGTLQL